MYSAKAKELYSEMYRYALLVSILAFLIPFATVDGQHINEWRSHTSFATVSGMVMDDEGNTWAATEGGVFAYNGNELVTTLTTLDGLSNLHATAIHYDPNRDQIIMGYLDGTIDILDADSYSVQTHKEIERAERFSPRSINDFAQNGNMLYVATDFGIVKYDLETMLVQSTYVKLGRFNPAASVFDIFITDGRLYCGTREGIAVGPVNQDLGQPESWMNYDEENGFVDNNVHAIITFNGNIYAATPKTNYVYKGSNWQKTSQFGPNPVFSWQRSDNKKRLYGISSSGIYKDSLAGSGIAPIRLPPNTNVRSFMVPDNEKPTFWIGTISKGLAYATEQGRTFQFYKPEGPWLNFFNEVHSDSGVVLATSQLSFPGASPIANQKGYYLFKNDEWFNYNMVTNDQLRQRGFKLAFSAAISDDYFYVGSWGQGVVRQRRGTDSLKVFNANNSDLVGIGGDYIVAAGLDTDQQHRIWTTSYLVDPPLFFMEKGGDDWQSLPRHPAVTGSDHYYHLFIDSHNRKWISLLSADNNGRGLLVLNTNNTPADPSDDRAVKLTENFNKGNLPDAKVHVVREDHNGEIWIGTAQGVARFILPGRIIRGGPADRRAQWLINADTTAESPYLLRDVNATALAVNAANQKWIGSSGNGVWLVNADGSRILEHFTKQNSPLIGNQIHSIAIDNQTGTVYFSTNNGLASYTDVPKASVEKMNQLNIYPNPFSYQASGVIIDNLAEKTTVRILTIDGQLVEEIKARGGRIKWDGLDGSGNRVATGIYLIVALGEDGDKAIGKLAIVR